MSAAVAPGTPAANSAAPAPATAADHGLDAVLGDLSQETAEIDDNGDAALDALAAGDDAPETQPDAEPEPAADKAPRTPDAELFSDEALATPEGVKAAAARLRERDKMQFEAYHKLKKFEKRVVKRAAKFDHTLQTFRNEKQNHDLLIGNVRSNLTGLHSGDPDTIITALGNLTGQDGIRALELLNSRLVNRGRSQIDPQVQSVIDGLQREVEQLKGGLNEREATATVQHLDHQINQHHQAIQQQVLTSTTTPHLARIMRDDPQRLTRAIVKVIEDTNGKIPASQLYAQMEEEIRAHVGGSAPQGEGGGPAPKQPATAQRSPGQSVGPRTAAVSNPRQPSEEESLRALADDAELMRSLGLG